MDTCVKAPKDPEKKRSGFYIMRKKEIAASPQPDGRGVQFLYMDGERLTTCARIVGNVTDGEMLEQLTTAQGFRTLVHSIGVSAELVDGKSTSADFVMQMYGTVGSSEPATLVRIPVPMDGMEQMIRLSDVKWSAHDRVLGQFRFEFPNAGELAVISVKLYLNDGFQAPEEEPEEEPDLNSPEYQEMLRQSLMQTGNPARLRKAIAKARRGEDVTIAFIGGSITQGAGAVPINTECYAYQTYRRFCAAAGCSGEEHIHYIKAGVGGTPSELGMLRYERDVLREGSAEPDVVIVEFAVNDAGDETGGECYDSLIRKILKAENAPAVILLFAVFANDWNLQERLAVVGEAYDLPMVSVRDAVVPQFYRKSGAGKVFSKSQFFYDCYHPTNLGHKVMADCIGYLFETVERMGEEAPGQAGAGHTDTPREVRAWENVPPIGGEFEDVRTFDRKGLIPAGPLYGDAAYPVVSLDCGSFCYQDTGLQAVEMDLNLVPTKEFPNNWMHRGAATPGSGCIAGADSVGEDSTGADSASADSAGAAGEPFAMDVACSALLLIYKDSGSPAVGKAEVFVDGEKVLTADPHANGWVHCNPLICFRGGPCRTRHVEVRMAPGDEDKEFTILGFGFVR